MNKIMKLFLTLGIITLCILVTNNDNKIVTTGEINNITLFNVSNKIKLSNLIVTENERILIKIDSPGGSGKVMRQLVTLLESSEVPIDTYIDDNAASAGAILFMLGDNRYINPKATVTFHSAHFGSYALTEPTLKRAVDLIDEGKLENLMFLKQTGQLKASDVDLETYKAVEVASAVVESSGLSGLVQTLDSMYVTLKIANELQLETVYKAMNKLDSTVTRGYVKRTMFADFKLDVTFTGKQLIDMGLAQEFKGEK